ncbi:hypothetical protein WOLCODRAFT_121729, partial [Wolfiporia cocos MD-104 SS10]
MDDDQQHFVHAQLPVHTQYDRDRLEYELTVRQEPKQARMCGVGGKADRRPIDPPPIVQLRVIDPAQRRAHAHGSRDSSPGEHISTYGAYKVVHTACPEATAASIASQSFLQNPYYFMFASLAKPDEDVELHWLKDGKTRCTTGSVVSSLYHLKDAESGGIDAGFFVFPDLSVRTEGSYRLKLSLFEVVGASVYHCKSIFSAPFYVYTAKKFPGMEESTQLSCALADQGIKIRIRKDIRVRKRPSHGLGEAPVPLPGPPPGGAFGPVPVRLDDPELDEQQSHSQTRDRTGDDGKDSDRDQEGRTDESGRESSRDARRTGRRDSGGGSSAHVRRSSTSERIVKRSRGEDAALGIQTSISTSGSVGGGLGEGQDASPTSAGPSSAGATWGPIDPALTGPATQAPPAHPQAVPPAASAPEHHYVPAPAPGPYEHRFPGSSAPPTQGSPPVQTQHYYDTHTHHAGAPPPPPPHHYPPPPHYAPVPPPQHHSAYPYPPTPAPPPAPGQAWYPAEGYPYAHHQPYAPRYEYPHAPPPARYGEYPAPAYGAPVPPPPQGYYYPGEHVP